MPHDFCALCLGFSKVSPIQQHREPQQWMHRRPTSKYRYNFLPSTEWGAPALTCRWGDCKGEPQILDPPQTAKFFGQKAKCIQHPCYHLCVSCRHSPPWLLTCTPACWISHSEQRWSRREEHLKTKQHKTRRIGQKIRVWGNVDRLVSMSLRVTQALVRGWEDAELLRTKSYNVNNVILNLGSSNDAGTHG